MTIEYARPKDPDGLSFDTGNPYDAVVQSVLAVAERRAALVRLSPGDYDITPAHPDGLDLDYSYSLTVEADRTRTITMTPATPGSQSELRGVDTAPIPGIRKIRLPDQASIVPIAARRKNNTGAVFGCIFYTPDTMPARQPARTGRRRRG